MKKVFKYIGGCLLAASVLFLILGLVMIIIYNDGRNFDDTLIKELGWILLSISLAGGFVSFLILDTVM